jgi:hypothetical protein
MSRAVTILRRCASRPFLSLGWIVVFLHAAGVLQMALTWPKIYIYAPIYFVLLAVIGLLKQWGPPVLFTLGGFCTTFYWRLFGPPAVGHFDPIESVMQGLGYPAMCAVLGFVLGIVLESPDRIEKCRNSSDDLAESQPPPIDRR